MLGHVGRNPGSEMCCVMLSNGRKVSWHPTRVYVYMWPGQDSNEQRRTHGRHEADTPVRTHTQRRALQPKQTMGNVSQRVARFLSCPKSRGPRWDDTCCFPPMPTLFQSVARSKHDSPCAWRCVAILLKAAPSVCIKERSLTFRKCPDSHCVFVLDQSVVFSGMFGALFPRGQAHMRSGRSGVKSALLQTARWISLVRPLWCNIDFAPSARQLPS